MEVEEQPKVQVSGTEIGSQLDEVDVMEPLNRFQFYDDLSGDHKVDAGSPYRYVLEGDVDWKLRLERYVSVRKRNPHRTVIDRFEKARAQLSMHGKSRPDNLDGDFLESKHP